MRFIGIDPGASGGIAVLDGLKMSLLAMPPSPQELFRALVRFIPDDPMGSTRVAVEKVSGYAGGEGQPGSRMFNFGRGFGWLEMGLEALGVTVEYVIPRTWQKGLGISPRKGSEKKGPWKARLKKVAQVIFPRRPITLENCDALLIAEWLKRKTEGKL